MKHEATTIAQAVREAIEFLTGRKSIHGNSILAYVMSRYAGREWHETSIKSVIRQMHRPQTLRRLDNERLHIKRRYEPIRRVGMHGSF